MIFKHLDAYWSVSTLVLYISIILFCYFCMKKKNTRYVRVFVNSNKNRLFRLNLFIVTALLLFIKCFGTTGNDLRGGYADNFVTASSLSEYRDQTVEIGFRFLNVIIWKLTQNYYILIIVVGFFTVIPIIYIINKYRDSIDLSLAVLLYVCVFFVQGFSPIRQYLAASILILAFDAIIDKKFYKGLLLVLFASTFHITSLVFIVPIVITMQKRISPKILIMGLLVMFIIGYLERGSILDWLENSSRYYMYVEDREVEFGMEQIVYYLPFFYLLYEQRNSSHNRWIYKVSVTFVLYGFLLGMLGYVVLELGRLQGFFTCFVLIGAFYEKAYIDSHMNRRRIVELLSFLYCFARFLIFIIQYYDLQALMPYTNILGWVI